MRTTLIQKLACKKGQPHNKIPPTGRCQHRRRHPPHSVASATVIPAPTLRGYNRHGPPHAPPMSVLGILIISNDTWSFAPINCRNILLIIVGLRWPCRKENALCPFLGTCSTCSCCNGPWALHTIQSHMIEIEM